jgi:hypothetical protein
LAFSIALAAAGALSALTPAGAAPLPGLPQSAAARLGAAWLARQFNAQGFVPTTAGGDQPNYSGTAQSVLALSAADVDLATARRALGYLAANLSSYVTVTTADGPGQLALLILDAEALGVDPHSLGGTDPVARLVATQQTSGPDAGLFGTDAQLGTYQAGTYDQGLALAALAGAGVQGTAPVGAAIAWLRAQQCPAGGWTLPDQALNPCTGTPSTFQGPDTNSTALAVEGLAAQGALSGAGGAALGFLQGAQDADAGWSYFPSSPSVAQTTQPTSTALVIQALLALGSSPTGAPFAKDAATPVSALLHLQVSHGNDTGAFYFPPSTTAGNLIATYEAVPALAARTVPFGPAGGGYQEVAADGGVFGFGDAGYFGSMGGHALAAPVVGVSATPDGQGYWEVAADGGVFGFGDAGYFGSMGGHALAAPVVGISATPDGQGYWEVAADGGVFGFGDAGYFGSMGGHALAAPVVGVAGSTARPT